MKVLLTFTIAFIGFIANSFSQQTDPRIGFTYQALAIDRSQSEGFGRDTQGKVLANQNVTLRFNIREGNASGDVKYQETHDATTDAFGIFRLVIGRGISNSDVLLEELSWGQIAYFLEIEIDLGSGFQLLGTEELHGAPFALNTIPQKLSLNNHKELSISQGNMVDLSGIVGSDSSPTNEIQDISTNGNSGDISISDGSTITLNVNDADADDSNEIQDLTLNGNILTITNNPAASDIDLSGLAGSDSSPTNEIQDISTNGNSGDISISDGSTITLNVNDADADDSNEIQDLTLNGNILTITNNPAASDIDLSGLAGSDSSPTNEIQDISTNGNPGDISIGDGSTLTLNVNDADSDDSNEIQDLALNGKILTITNNTSASDIDLSGLVGDGAFSTTSNVTSNEPGDYSTDDFVFGSPQMDDDGNIDHDYRMFFDKSNGAFRAGQVISSQWDESNRGNNSVAFGFNTVASGLSAVAFGYESNASGSVSFATGFQTNATASYSLASGVLTTASGLNSISMGNRSTASGDGAVAIGGQNESTGNYSLAMGFSVESTGDTSIGLGYDLRSTGRSSVALGENTRASSNYSFAAGLGTEASAQSSTSLGRSTIASGEASTSTGLITTASGRASFSSGHETFSRSYSETAIGSYNTDYNPLSTGGVNFTDRLFVVGNGWSDSNRSDALIIYKNGNATFSGTLTETSDARLKKDITPISNSYSRLIDLNGVNFKWNSIKPHDTTSLQTGFIAQEVEKLFPELVQTDAEGYKSVNYIGLIPHLLEAIKKLDTENNTLKADLKEEREIQSKKMDELETRLRILENRSGFSQKRTTDKAKSRGK